MDGFYLKFYFEYNQKLKKYKKYNKYLSIKQKKILIIKL